MDVERTPDISLVIPAWNEEAYLPRLLDSVDCARARYAGGAEAVEVIVADNASTDRTAAIARERGCRVAPVEKRCIAAARNAGAAIARGEILAFADADFRIHPETFNAIRAFLARPGFIGGGTSLVMERSSPGIRLTLLMVLPMLSAMGIEGGVWFCRRADFETLGGYDERVRIGEDVRFMRALKRLGRTRRPRERLATRRAARRLGITPAPRSTPRASSTSTGISTCSPTWRACSSA